MQPAKERTLVLEDEEEEEVEGVTKEKESGTKVKEGKKTSPGRVDAASTDVQQAPGASAGPERHTRTQMRRAKKKLMKKQLKAADSLGTLMSELPFSLTSPATWKELGFSSSKSAQTERERKRKRGDNGGRVDSEEDAEMKKKKRESQRPNFFVSIPITDTRISSAVLEVQEAVLQQEPRLARAMIPVPTLHITLLVTHLASQEQVDL
ncbi:A-kinase anchor protein 7 isoform gamma [Liparis tanakae]|uniref:A-kinase anchor protein 7 isoform gamma n=1 Tax=Liparis tanakae TaxID=230148 RepID=A0A4Z2FNG3_9TELE|nr:A-kinase anchor protein 7 isoform gamma [Liparis tanakae]